MKKSIIISIVLLILFSCSSKDISDNSSPDNSNSVLVKKIAFSNMVNPAIYTYNGNKLVKVLGNDGDAYLIFTYMGDLITKTEWVNLNNVSSGEYNEYIYKDNKLTQKKAYAENILQYIYDYVYNTDGTTQGKVTGYNGNSNISIFKYYYDGVGNMIKSEQFYHNTLSSTTNYTYDTKNNPFKNITGFRVLAVAGSSSNNIVKVKSTYLDSSSVLEEINSYQYNSQDYPISCLSTEPNRTITTTYYY